MMVIDRYIARTVTLGCLLAGFVIMSIFAFVDFISQLNSVGTGDFGVFQAVVYVFMRLPQRLYELAPSVLLLGGILSLGTLAANSELIVMRASGISVLRITRSVLQVGFFIAIIVAALGELAVPYISGAATAYRAEAMEKKLLVGSDNDIWARDGNRFINVKKILPDNELRDVRVYEIDENNRLSKLIHAERAHYTGDEWELNNISSTSISSDGTETVFDSVLRLKRLILLEMFTVLELHSRDMSASQLLTYSNYLQENKLDSGEYRLAFWVKVFTPMTCLAMLLIAMPIVFATTPRSGGIGQRIMIAVVIGVVYFVLNRTINYLGLALDVSPVLSASLPLVVVTGISLYFMQRIR